MSESTSQIDRPIRGQLDQPIRERIEKNMKYPNLNSPGAGSESTKSSSSIQRLNLNPNWKNTPMIVAMVGLPGKDVWKQNPNRSQW